MSHGPPTPPPTSTTELMDQEKDAASSTAPAAAPVAVAPPAAAAPPPATVLVPAPPPTAPAPAPPAVSVPAPTPTSGASSGPDHYSRLLPTVVDLVAQHNYLELIRVAELDDLRVESDERPSRFALTAPLVLAYLIQDELPPARVALMRLPQTLTAHPLSQALFQLLAVTWERRYPRVYACAEALYTMVRQPGFLDANIAPVLTTMITEFVEIFRRRAVALVANAYSSLPLAAAQPYIGLPAEQVTALLTGNGWAYDPVSQTLTAPPLARIPTGGVSSGMSTLATFQLVAATAAEVEA